jgi:hypothetical protein
MEPSTENRELTASEIDVVEGGMAEKTEKKDGPGKGFGPADFLKW